MVSKPVFKASNVYDYQLYTHILGLVIIGLKQPWVIFRFVNVTRLLASGERYKERILVNFDRKLKMRYLQKIGRKST